MPVNRKEILYPIFLECCQYTENTFWENIFENLAYGKTPYGTFISKDFLCCNYKKKEFSYKIERKCCKILYQEVYDILTTKLGLMSTQEKITKQKEFDDLEEHIKDSRKTWANIRKKNMKELFIELYVTRMKEKHNLTIKQARYLNSIIMLGIIFKVINSDDIIYKNGNVEEIKGISFDKKKIVFERNFYEFESNNTPTIILDKKTMIENWEKFIKEKK